MAYMNFINPAAVNKINKIKELLSKKEMTTQELSEYLFTCKRNASAYIKHLKENNLVYISSYKEIKLKKYVRNVAFYKFGSKPDVKKPAPKTGKEKGRLQRLKLLNDPELHEFFNAKRRRARIKPKTDWTSSWIQR